MGIDLTAVSSIPGTIGGWTRDNDRVIEAVRRYPDRFLGYITVNAHAPGSVVPECERCWEAGCRALKLHSGQGLDYDHPNLAPALDFARERGCPILFHVWGRELEHMEPLIDRYHQNTWILAHAGCVDRENYARVASEHGNAVLETCFSRCPKGLLEYFVDQGLEDKVLWGSDAEFYASTHQFGRVLFAELPEGVKKKLLCDNAQRVFELQDPSPGG
jgi:predicted TIM-barrel fold metal-dependent hydrolase